MTIQQLQAIKAVADAVCEAVAVAGEQGAPGGVLYSALMAHGVSLSVFQSIMSGLVRAGRLTQRGNFYFIVPR